ncbi:hypothetical protein HY612_04445 [Candidatus Roizmanbacteria bacterium]|nr:hypothetical protein [Candidatus Roizmanbacteria bacterium]
MNIRSELFNRAVREDKTAKQVLSSLSTSRLEQVQRREEFIKSISQTVPVTHVVSVKVKLPRDKVQSITSSVFNAVSSSSQFVTNIAQNTNLQSSQVKTVLNSLAQNISQPAQTIVDKISQKTGVEKEKITQVIQSLHNAVFFNPVAASSQFVTNVAQNTKLQNTQVKSVLKSLNQNMSQPADTIPSKVSQETGIEKEKVTHIIQAYYKTVEKNKELAKQVAQEQNIKEEQVEKILTEQLPVIAQPEKQIEKTISIPPSVSLDEYEQVKKMWKDQYERGEVPISDLIKSRDDWIDQDTVFITNTLNKLVSDSPELKQEGLDDLGYILPIFLINNLKGDELLVYLKAKLEAAKEVQELKEKEKEVEEKVKEEKVEEFVEVEKPKAEEKEKVMEMKEELEDKQATETKEDKSKTLGETEKQAKEKEEEFAKVEKPKIKDEEKVMEAQEKPEEKQVAENAEGEKTDNDDSRD